MPMQSSFVDVFLFEMSLEITRLQINAEKDGSWCSSYSSLAIKVWVVVRIVFQLSSIIYRKHQPPSFLLTQKLDQRVLTHKTRIARVLTEQNSFCGCYLLTILTLRTRWKVEQLFSLGRNLINQTFGLVWGPLLLECSFGVVVKDRARMLWSTTTRAFGRRWIRSFEKLSYIFLVSFW